MLCANQSVFSRRMWCLVNQVKSHRLCESLTCNPVTGMLGQFASFAALIWGRCSEARSSEFEAKHIYQGLFLCHSNASCQFDLEEVKNLDGEFASLPSVSVFSLRLEHHLHYRLQSTDFFAGRAYFRNPGPSSHRYGKIKNGPATSAKEENIIVSCSIASEIRRNISIQSQDCTAPQCCFALNKVVHNPRCTWTMLASSVIPHKGLSLHRDTILHPRSP